MTETQKLIKETIDVRDKAEGLLRSLLEAKKQSDAFLESNGQRDKLQSVTGKSSIENAIVETRRMIDTLNRHMEQFKTVETP
jgi:hypothetical protein